MFSREENTITTVDPVYIGWCNMKYPLWLFKLIITKLIIIIIIIIILVFTLYVYNKTHIT